MSNPHEIELYIDTTTHLFEEPELSVDSVYIGRSAGIDQLKDKLLDVYYLHNEQFRLSIHIHDRQGYSPHSIIEALRRCAKNRIDRNEIRIKITKREGRVYFLYALIFLVLIALILYILSILVPNITTSVVGIFITEVLIIAGWVVLWWPIENLAYDWRPLKHENDVYNIVLMAPIDIT